MRLDTAEVQQHSHSQSPCLLNPQAPLPSQSQSQSLSSRPYNNVISIPEKCVLQTEPFPSLSLKTLTFWALFMPRCPSLVPPAPTWHGSPCRHIAKQAEQACDWQCTASCGKKKHADETPHTVRKNPHGEGGVLILIGAGGGGGRDLESGIWLTRPTLLHSQRGTHKMWAAQPPMDGLLGPAGVGRSGQRTVAPRAMGTSAGRVFAGGSACGGVVPDQFNRGRSQGPDLQAQGLSNMCHPAVSATKKAVPSGAGGGGVQCRLPGGCRDPSAGAPPLMGALSRQSWTTRHTRTHLGPGLTCPPPQPGRTTHLDACQVVIKRCRRGTARIDVRHRVNEGFKASVSIACAWVLGGGG